MQIPAQIVAKKQLLQTIGLTSAAFLVALPVGAAVLGSNGGVAGAAGTTTTVTKSVEDLGSCDAGTAQQVTTTTTRTSQGTSTSRGINQAGTNNSANNSGATAQASDHSIATAINVGDVLSNNSILNDNNIPVLSGNTVTVEAPVTVPVAVPVVTGLLNGLGL